MYVADWRHYKNVYATTSTTIYTKAEEERATKAISTMRGLDRVSHTENEREREVWLGTPADVEIRKRVPEKTNRPFLALLSARIAQPQMHVETA